MSARIKRTEIPAAERLSATSSNGGTTAEVVIKHGIKTRTVHFHGGGAMGHISLYGSASIADAVEALTALDAELQKAVAA